MICFTPSVAPRRVRRLRPKRWGQPDVGFRRPPDLSEEGKKLYATKLHSAPHNRRMKSAGASGTHLGWARERFARRWLAPMILSDCKAVASTPFVASGPSPLKASDQEVLKAAN